MAKASTKVAVQRKSLLDEYVFMDKTKAALDVALKTKKNILLFGPGGHGKSEYSTEYLYEKGITPFVVSVGKGTTIDKLLGGFDIKKYDETGKIEYLLENSIFNHEFGIIEEMFDAPDYVLEQLKDTLSSGFVRNGTQVFEIKTKMLIGCTNKTREEFAKNDSLKALMERFPLEHNVIWDNYTEASYNTLLEKRFGVNKVDPIMPFVLQEYTRNNITISPRIALDAYDVFEDCGPDNLIFIAEFAKKPTIMNEALAKFQESIRFKTLGVEIQELAGELTKKVGFKTQEEKAEFVKQYGVLHSKVQEVKNMSITDDLISEHTAVCKTGDHYLDQLRARYTTANSSVFDDSIKPTPTQKKKKPIPSPKNDPWN